VKTVKLKCQEIPYVLELPDDLDKGLAGATAMLQLPDGLKQYSREIADCLSDAIKARILIQGDSVFGACDLHYGEVSSLGYVDAILHVGHTPYPDYLGDRVNVNPKGRVKVFFIAARYVGLPSEQTMESLLSLLRARSLRRIAVATTTQYLYAYRFAASYLRERGLEVVTFRGPASYYEEGQVIGCDYSFVPRGVEGYVIISGGEFHALGLYLATFRPVIQLDVYKDKAYDMTGAGEKLYASRLFKVSMTMNSSRWGIIVGTKTGQHRPWVVSALEAMLSRRGLHYKELYVGTLAPQILANFDSDWYQTFVITSCPRLPIDDFNEYPKPVLTPGEAFMAIEGKLSPYRFPW
jgi:2-(3-amino-3-carboxypropyl)histidine synthase